jgi:hypothetical protein
MHWASLAAAAAAANRVNMRATVHAFPKHRNMNSRRQRITMLWSIVPQHQLQSAVNDAVSAVRS